MATLEKPKKHSTKKSTKPHRDAPNLPALSEALRREECDNEAGASQTVLASRVNALNLSDLAGAQGSATHSIVSLECQIASHTLDTQKNEDIAAEVKKVNNAEEEVKHPLECTNTPTTVTQAETVVEGDDADRLCQTLEAFAEELHKSHEDASTSNQPWTAGFEEPSAPEAPPAPIATVAAKVLLPSPIFMHYPDLSHMKQVEVSAEVLYRPQYAKSPIAAMIKSQLKPFTADQLRSIYACYDLELVKQFELDFLMTAQRDSHEHDELYGLVSNYYHLQSRLTMNLQDIEKHRKLAEQEQQLIWKTVTKMKTFSVTCKDGVKLTENVYYDIMQVQDKHVKGTSSTLRHIKDLVCDAYTTNNIRAEITKYKIKGILNEILVSSQKFFSGKTTGLMLNDYVDAEMIQFMSRLKRALSILFSFTRQLSPNKKFESDLKTWIQELVSLYLLLASKADHWFLFFHILRCPRGIHNWALPFIQVPCTFTKNKSALVTKAKSKKSVQPTELPLAIQSPEIGNCLAMLQILMIPIKKRNEFLQALTKSQKEITDPVKDERWILIDSDGEETHTPAGECVGLKETDLIGLLNQIPFQKLFASVLSIEKFIDDYILESDLISAQQLLTVIAFFDQLIEILGEGMLLYNSERYKRLVKRLSRLVRHVLDYVTDYHELFIRNNVYKDGAQCERIAVELNALLIKACSYLHRMRNMGTWQYLSSLPFSSMDAATILQIFYYLNMSFPTEFPVPYEDFSELLNASDFWQKFNSFQADTSPEDMNYLLQTFFEMANQRDVVKDWHLIKIISLHTFYIGFLNESTRELCYKSARDVLVNLSLLYVDVIPTLLLELRVRFNEIINAAFIFRSLPLDTWKPRMDSFDILSNWLLHFDIRSAENGQARLIISLLNWGFDVDNKRLFLPHNIHVRMACLVSEALTKHAPEKVGSPTISESVREASFDLERSTKEGFSQWCWTMISILRLHLMDQSVEAKKALLENPMESLVFVPELEHMDVIYQGVTERRPLAIFIALLTSQWGHSIPLICQRGFEQIKLLLNDQRPVAVIRCLELIVPLFLDTPETLASCEKFQEILNNLLNADNTFLKMAKDMLIPNEPGPILSVLNSMMHNQIIKYTDYGMLTPINLINIWLHCLTNLPNWQTSNAIFLLNKLLRMAYMFPHVRAQAELYFCNYYKDCDEWKGMRKTATLKNFFNPQTPRIPPILPTSPWLALTLLELEYNVIEKQFWPELLRQLAKTVTKTGVEEALKKTLAIVKINSFAPHMLLVYKYANLLTNMTPSHSLFPIVCQKFFELFLARVPLDSEEVEPLYRNGVSYKFYEYHVGLMKSIKAKLKEAEKMYDTLATEFAVNEDLSHFYRQCTKLMHTFVLWLEETDLSGLIRNNLPPQYNSEKLNELLNGNTAHWTEFVNLPYIQKNARHRADCWARKSFRHIPPKAQRNSNLSKPLPPPKQRIIKRLSAYDAVLPPPEFIWPQTHAIHSSINDNTFSLLKGNVDDLSKTSSKLALKSRELSALNYNFIEAVLHLYEMVTYYEERIKNCTSTIFARECTGPATLKVELQKINTDERKLRIMNENRSLYDLVIEHMLNWDVGAFVEIITNVNNAIIALVEAHANQANESRIVKQTGLALFYCILDSLIHGLGQFPPADEFGIQALSELGIFIRDNQAEQGIVILQKTLQNPKMLKSLADVVVPSRTSPNTYIEMYKFLVNSYLKRCDNKVLFVLLSKFDMENWLNTFHPKLQEINELLHLILRGLECWSEKDSSLLQDIFRCHLGHIYVYDFPQHYGEVIQLVLDRVSDNKIMPDVLLDLLNMLLQRYNCEPLKLDQKWTNVTETLEHFARVQTLFNLNSISETIKLFTRHFEKERFHHGLHGLYPKHQNYCLAISMWFTCLGYVVVITTICTYQEMLAEQISEVIFSHIIDMYAPWLICYNGPNQQQAVAQWIKELTKDGTVLLPWSEKHSSTSKYMIQPFIDTLNFVLTKLPVCIKILNHTLGWYVHHFAAPSVPTFVLTPIHECLTQLPWQLCQLMPNNLEILHNALNIFLPESHAFLAHIFLRIDWRGWMAQIYCSWLPSVQVTAISHMLAIFVKMAFEPNIHAHTTTSKILEDAIKYPWHLVELSHLEALLQWFINSVDATIFLNIPAETNYADRAVMDLLYVASAMVPERSFSLGVTSQDAGKRLAFTRCAVRMLRSCVTKNQKLLATKAGMISFKAALLQFLNRIDDCIHTLKTRKSQESARQEALGFMLEFLLPMQTQSQETSNLFVDILLQWQSNRSAGNILSTSILYASAHMKTFIQALYHLLESCIEHYFHVSETCREWHNPTWQSLLEILKPCMEKVELVPLIDNSYIFLLHAYAVCKFEELPDTGAKITFLQDLSQLAENLNTDDVATARQPIIWGFIISRSCRLLAQTENAKKVLLMLARQLQMLTAKSDSWGESFLGALGLNRDVNKNKYKLLLRCLSCIVFSLFPNIRDGSKTSSQEYSNALQELSMLLANKKFADLKLLIVQTVALLNENKFPELRDVPHLTSRSIGLFYVDDFLISVPEVWDFEFSFIRNT